MLVLFHAICFILTERTCAVNQFFFCGFHTLENLLFLNSSVLKFCGLAQKKFRTIKSIVLS